ncbi:hypothetical protein Afil01_32940 [Actinorhabdospora filicis]|uniref:Secreted protein n=1 Tax=Actinorhabdospora filicis TaxID=1785913 RepID=A0A9W6W3S6_9ACTN|nr:DUF748 domain-containing protein [Actinorhabdospora filicis]GLZ78487.1 hypothetical protein Afil01_32940 [Actinorhabdospora filicis]
MNDHAHHTTGHGGARPGGLAVSEDGYTLELDAPILASGTQRVAFRIIGPDGRPVTAFEREHEKELHFIAVRRDTTGFQHVHPVRDETGTWSTELTLTPGAWRFFADIHPSALGRTLTLGADASVGGLYEPRPLPEDTATAGIGEYTVTLKGELTTAAASRLTLTVSRDGVPVTDLQPYLGAYGHLVALRAGDLGYLHVHPESGVDAVPGPDITFVVVAPTGGVYRLYLDFQHHGVVRTADFTVRATDGDAHDYHGHH